MTNKNIKYNKTFIKQYNTEYVKYKEEIVGIPNNFIFDVKSLRKCLNVADSTIYKRIHDGEYPNAKKVDRVKLTSKKFLCPRSIWGEIRIATEVELYMIPICDIHAYYSKTFN